MAHKQAPESAEGKALDLFAAKVKEKSKGRLKVDVYPAEQLGKTQASLEMLRAGTVQLYAEEIGFLQRYVPGFKVFYLSFAYRDFDHWRKFIESEMVRKWREQLEKDFGITVLGTPACFKRGPYRVLVSTRPILKLKDLEGLRMRMYEDETAVSIWKSLGADPMILAWTEVYESLKRGVVAGVTAPMGIIETAKFTEVAKYMLETDEYPQGMSFMMDTKSFGSLSPDLKKIVLESYQDAGAWHTQIVDKYAEESLARMIQQDDLTFVRPSMKEWMARMRSIYPKWEEEGKLPKGIIEYISNVK
jgi:tripartite ATP-independent transporter DctP family solute receptor